MSHIQKTSAELQKGEDYDPEENIDVWLEFMNQVQDSTASRLPFLKNLLVAGDDEAEKMLLIARFQGNKNPKKGNALDYHFINVTDDYHDDRRKLGVWILDADPSHDFLLKYVLKEQTYPHTAMLLVGSMKKPWDILHSIKTWAEILEKHISNFPQKMLNEQKSGILKRFRDYTEPGSSVYGSDFGLNGAEVTDNELPNNTGLEIIVVITGSDYMKTLTTDFGYEDEHFDFIQLCLRKFCLSYGAALFYVSLKEDNNCDLLFRYIQHKVYGFSFRMPAILTERDSIFVPAGWDNLNKIGFLSNNLLTIRPDVPYEDIIFKPSRLCEPKLLEPDVKAESNQDFLFGLEEALNAQGSLYNVKQESARNNGVQRSSTRRVSRTPNIRTSPKKPETNLGTGEGDTVLHTFFKSLLNKKQNVCSVKPACVPQSAEEEIAEAEKLSDQKNTAYGKSPDRSLSLGSSDYDKVRDDRSGTGGNRDKLGAKGTSLDENNLNFNKTLHLSLDQVAKDTEKFPEGSDDHGGDVPECCFHPDEDNDFLDDNLIDRVRSDFNPPLRVLLNREEAENSVQNGWSTDSAKLARKSSTDSSKGSVVNSAHLATELTESEPSVDNSGLAK